MKYIYFLLFALVLSSCSIFQSSDSEGTVKEEKPESTEEVYVFDDDDSDENEVEPEDIKNLENELDNAVNEDVKEEQIDVFNDNNDVNTANRNIQGNSFYLQLGAFSSLKRAEQFVDEIRVQVPFNVEIIFKPQTSFYTVRSNAYSTRGEVEKLRADLWSKNLFKNAFILTE